jgi:putative glutamine amidotransferase
MGAYPLVGLTTSASVDAYPERAYTNAAYVMAVQQAGGIPILLPPQLSVVAREELWRRLDALVLTGGGDLDPARFGEARHRTVYDVSAARDELETDLTRRALAEDVPLLAICRGIQVLNVVLGGTLYQDIPSDLRSPIEHSQKERRDQPTHAVKVQEGSRLAEILGRLEVDVNSFHHQAVKDLGSRLKMVGMASDGVIEAAEVTDHPFAVAVQWHPEDLVAHDRAARGIFRALVEAAGRSALRSLR